MSDKELFNLCKKWGRVALEARRKFIGLLPEVARRGLHLRRGYSSLYEFAGVLAGVGREHVDCVLRLAARFEAMPTLHAALVSGEIGLSKLVRVAAIASVENERELCEKVRKLSKQAVEILVREIGGGRERSESREIIRVSDAEVWPSERLNYDGEAVRGGDLNLLAGEGRPVGDLTIQNSSGVTPDSVPGQRGFQQQQASLQSRVGDIVGATQPELTTISKSDLELLQNLSGSVKDGLKDLIKKGLDVNTIIAQALAKREQEIANAKTIASEEYAEMAEEKAVIGLPAASSRHVPAATRRLLRLEYGKKCSVGGCSRPAQQLHHEQPFAKYQSHNPWLLKPLCRGHHELIHSDSKSLGP